MLPADIHQLRDLKRYRFKLTCLLRRYWINFCKIPQILPLTFEPFAFKSLKKKLPELCDAITKTLNPRKQILKSFEHFLQIAPDISSEFTTIGIISEVGTNMEAFPLAKYLCSWAGHTPTNNESTGKKKSIQLSKAECYTKPLFVQCTNAVAKSNKHPEMRNRYLRLKSVAVTRKQSLP